MPALRFHCEICDSVHRTCDAAARCERSHVPRCIRCAAMFDQHQSGTQACPLYDERTGALAGWSGAIYSPSL